MSLGFSTFMIMKDKTVKACGYNNCGQLGLGDTINRTVLTTVPDLINVIYIFILERVLIYFY